MKIVKKLNNNVVLAQDRAGRELIVFGKGVGFPAMPYELEDLSRIQRTFYNVQPQYMALLNDLPQEMIFLAADIAENAQDELDCELRIQNLTFSLADHLNYAVERACSGLDVTTPLAFDVKNLYPHEYQLGRSALELVEQRTGVRLPDSEAVNMALHIINAENEADDMHATMTTAEVINDITAIVENYFNIQLDRSSFHYSRFTMHLRHLVQRLMSGTPIEPLDDGGMFRLIQRENPDLYGCMREICEYLAQKWDWECSRDEQLYLMMHLNRVRAER